MCCPVNTVPDIAWILDGTIAFAQSQIIFVDILSFFHCYLNLFSSIFVFGNQHNSRGQLIKTMCYMNEIFLVPRGHQRKYVSIYLCSALYCELTWLVYHSNVLVLIYDMRLKNSIACDWRNIKFFFTSAKFIYKFVCN